MHRMPASLRPLALSAALLLALAAGLYGVTRVRHRETPPPAAAGVVDWDAWLAELSDESFERPSGAWRPELPREHGAHPTARMETWNIAAHLANAGGERLGVQFSLLRVGLRPPDAAQAETPWELRELYRGHVALLSPERPAGEERFSRAVPGTAGYDEALREVRLDDWSLRFGQGEGGTELRLDASVGGTRLELRLTPAKAAMASAPEGDAPFRGYSLTRLDVRGRLGAGSALQPVSGLAWLDHAWGELPLPGGPIAWDRLQLQLDDGTDLSLTRARRREGGGSPTVEGYAVGPDGTPERLAGGSIEMEPSRIWRPDRNGAPYPVEWRLAGDGLELSVAPLRDDQLQDFVAPLWSGMVTAEGLADRRRVTGVGTLTLTGYEGQ
jgi:predicted secreted hydrolase